MNFVRARLSIFEVGVLFYNGLSEAGRGIRPLIERYALLKHIQPHQILSPAHREGYPSQAFGGVPA